MSLNDILKLSGSDRHEEIEITEELLMEHIDEYRELINY